METCRTEKWKILCYQVDTRGHYRGDTTRKRGARDLHKRRRTIAMIVFDENVHQRSIMDAVAAWYRGRVVSVTVPLLYLPYLSSIVTSFTERSYEL